MRVLRSSPIFRQTKPHESAWGSACHANDDLPHMPGAIRAKLEVNRARKWGARAADGTISHVKPASKGGEA